MARHHRRIGTDLDREALEALAFGAFGFHEKQQSCYPRGHRERPDNPVTASCTSVPLP